MDLSQRLALDPTLLVELAFDHPVMLEGGGEITSWRGAWDAIPRLARHDGHPVNVTPTFWLNAVLENLTRLDFDLTFSLDVLKGILSLGPITSPTLSLADKDLAIPLDSVNVFNERFGLGGFQPVTAPAFTLAAYTPPPPPPSSVPEPGTLLLLAAGLLGISWRQGTSATRRGQ